jgi:DNA-binding PadR family transcriptional regulator
MPGFEFPRAVLMAISNLSGDTYRDVDGTELMPELERIGHERSPDAVRNLLDRLKEDHYVDFYAAMGGSPDALSFIRLAEKGRQEVQGWPKASGISAADVEALLRAFETYANDPSTPEPERRKAGVIASTGRDLGVEVAGSVITSWLRSLGVG